MHGAAQKPADIRIDPRGVFIARGRRDPGQNVGAPRIGRAGLALRRARVIGDRVAQDPVGPAGFRRRQVEGVGHAQRRKDVVVGVEVQRLAGDLFNEGAENDEADIRVVEGLTGSELQRRGEGPVNAVRPVGGDQPPRALAAEVTADARGVREQHAQRHLRPTRIIAGIELGQVGLDGFVQTHPALFVQLEHGSGGHDDLRQRGDVEDGVDGHRLSGCGHAIEPRLIGEPALTECLAEHDLLVVTHLDHRTGKPTGGDVGVHESHDMREVPRGHNGFRRGRGYLHRNSRRGSGSAGRRGCRFRCVPARTDRGDTECGRCRGADPGESRNRHHFGRAHAPTG